MKLRTLVILPAIAITVICGCNSAQKEAEKLLESANYDFVHGRYDIALASIDSLRKLYPNAIEVRKQALDLQQRISLKKAQEEAEEADKMYQIANRDYEVMKKALKRSGGNFTQEEADELTRRRIERDSMKIRLDTQFAKIRYIHRRQMEKTK